MIYKISQKAARVNAQLTQEDVAKKMGVQRATVCNWENGKSKMKFYQKKQMANIYELDVNDIFFKDEVRKKRTYNERS